MQISKPKILIGFLVIILVIIVSLLLPKEEVFLQEEIYEPQETKEKFIYVHIDGAINNPGIKEVVEGTRLFELIELAGGETEDADLSRLNLASILKDEQKIIVPYAIIEEESNSPISSNNSAITTSKKSNSSISKIININYASVSELTALAGIGEAMAKRIVEYRDENGLFNSIEDIMNVSGIGEAKFNKIKDDITI